MSGAEDALREAAIDALAGWKYIRSVHGDLYGVGWDRVQDKLAAALASHPAAGDGEGEHKDTLAFVQGWMMSGDHEADQWHRDFAAAIDARARGAMSPEAFERAPKHRYWAAGEPDCPRDIKASNGELHTLRCKICGLDDPRNPICAALTAKQSPTPLSEGVEEAIARIIREMSRGRCEVVSYHKIYAVTEKGSLGIAQAILSLLPQEKGNG